MFILVRATYVWRSLWKLYRTRYQDLYRAGFTIALAVHSLDLSLINRLIVPYGRWWAVPPYKFTNSCIF